VRLGFSRFPKKRSAWQTRRSSTSRRPTIARVRASLDNRDSSPTPRITISGGLEERNININRRAVILTGPLMAAPSRSLGEAATEAADLLGSNREQSHGVAIIKASAIAVLVLSSKPSLASSLTRARHVLTATSATTRTALKSSNSSKSCNSRATWNSITRAAL